MATVIASYAAEFAAIDGKALLGARTSRLIEAVEVPVHIPFSSKVMAFDAAGMRVKAADRHFLRGMHFSG